MPESSLNADKSKLCRIIEENLPGASILAVPRKYFRDDSGQDYINQVTFLSRPTNRSSPLRRIWRV